MNGLANQKQFDGWLLVSDIDGTLNNKLRQTPKKNVEAIGRFVQQGGIFTLASGRNVQSLRKHFHKLPIQDMPAIVMNGSGIYDYKNEKFLYKDVICEKGMDTAQAVFERFPAAEIAVFTSDNIYCVRPKVCCPVFVAADHLRHVMCRDIREVPRGDWCKVIFFAPPGLLSRIIAFVPQYGGSAVKQFHSSVIGLEMVNGTANKGSAVLKLAEMLGIDRNKTAAIGDYYNDVDMLQAVALPAACGQAPDDVKALAKYKACHCNQGAVADFIQYIETTYNR